MSCAPPRRWYRMVNSREAPDGTRRRRRIWIWICCFRELLC
uniref:Uncharacterized protein n=1 Tax=Arundo donax TaxID=35708 RepID=A0A0A8Y9T4_ARUDO